MSNRLAIIIPAYKSRYLHETLRSIANQNCKKFTVYIGDDASPNELYEIIKKYEKDIDIIYKRFDENLGANDLIAHWNRCIRMSTNEEWIWLFSDDDVMDPSCVELFYKDLTLNQNEDIFHFNVKVIDSTSRVIQECYNYPDRLYAKDFFEGRIKFKISSYVVEYIFKKTKYTEEGGFQYFDLAWASDDASWIKFSKEKGIKTIKSAFVYWRLSNENISSITVNENIVFRKCNSIISYLQWVDIFFFQNNITLEVSEYNKFKWFFNNLKDLQKPLFFFLKVSHNSLNKLGYRKAKLKAMATVYVVLWYIKNKTIF
jgi:glycosyltransferase involved in cell wall biosynthesis